MRKQTLNKLYRSLLVLGFLGGTAALEMSCAKKKNRISGDSNNAGQEDVVDTPTRQQTPQAPEGETDPNLDPDADIKDLQPRVQLRNFNELNRTYSVLTGIPMADMQTVFEGLKTSLPSSENVADIGGAKINGAKELAANYCNAMSINNQLRTERFPGIDFNGAPAQAYSDVNAFAGMVIDHFWGVGLDTLPERSESLAEMSLLINDLITGNPGADKTPGVLMGACMAALSSTPVLLK